MPPAALNLSMGNAAAAGISAGPGPLWPFAGLLAAQVMLLFCILAGLLDLSRYLQFSLGVSIGATALWLLLAEKAETLPAADRAVLALLAAACSILGGPFGAAGVLAMMAARTSAGAAPAIAGGAMGAGGEVSRLERLHHTLLDGRLRLRSASAVRPLLDIMLSGEQKEKFNALRLIGRRYAPSMAVALKCAINDQDASVRVLGATVLARQHQIFLRRIGECQAAAGDSAGVASAWLHLAEAHLAYADSGLLESDRSDLQRQQAAECMARAGRPGHAELGEVPADDGASRSADALRRPWRAVHAG
jgi:hypothetical protein